MNRSYSSVVSTTSATFIFGGYYSKDTFEYLEKGALEWKLGETKIPVEFKSGCAVAISKDEIWLIGGLSTEDRILSFNVSSQNFTELEITLKQGREGHQCTIIPGTRSIIVTGGRDVRNKKYDCFNSTEIIDFETKSVYEGPPMNFQRGYHGIGVLTIDHKERVVVFGDEKSVEVLDAETNLWESTSIEFSEEKKYFGFLTIKSLP